MLYSAANLPEMSSPPVSTEPAGATPAMRQYFEAKRQYRDAIVFFRMGDFYEMFYEDALTAARALELTLTSRSKDSTGGAIPMCGVPYHAADGYIARLVQEGLPRRRLRAGGGSEEGQGARPARSRARGLARHADRRRLSRCARAGVPDGDLPRCQPAPGFGVALLDLSTGEFTAAEYTGRRRRARRWPTSSSVLRPREIVAPPASTTPRRSVAELRLEARADAGGRLDVRVRGGAAHAARRSCRRRRCTGSASTTAPAAVPRRRRAGAVPARHAEGGPRARPRDRVPDRRRLPGHRSDHAAEPRGDRGGRRRRGPDRCCTRSIARSRRWAAGCCAPGCCGRCVALERIQDRLDAVEEFAFRSTERAKVRDTLKIGPRHRAAGRRAPRSAPPARAISSRSASRSPPSRASACCSSEFQAPLVRSLLAELDDLAGSARRRSSARCSTSRRRSRATAASSATASIRSSTTCAASADPASSASPRWRRPSARAPASRR